MKSIAEKLKFHNLKVTPQRLAIYNSLCSSIEHPSAETVYRSIAEQYPSMSLSTVYKTLDSLNAAGIIQELSIGEDSFRYDAVTTNHPHLVCRKCHSVRDFHGSLDIDALRKNIAAKTDFSIEKEQLYFFGICGECRDSI